MPALRQFPTPALGLGRLVVPCSADRLTDTRDLLSAGIINQFPQGPH